MGRAASGGCYGVGDANEQRVYDISLSVLFSIYTAMCCGVISDWPGQRVTFQMYSFGTLTFTTDMDGPGAWERDIYLRASEEGKWRETTTRNEGQTMYCTRAWQGRR